MDDIFEFEGDAVTDFLLAIPALKVESDTAYPRGTHINAKAEFRIRSVRIEEDRKGNLTRHHVLVAESFRVTSFLTPEQRRANFEAEEAALAAAAENEQGVTQEQPSGEDAAWAALSPEEQAEARRQAVDEEQHTHPGFGDEEMIGHEVPADGTEYEVTGSTGEPVQVPLADATPTQEGISLIEDDADQYDPVNF